MMIPNRSSNKLYVWLKRKFSIAKSIEQTGSGNSQFGTIWTHNPNTKINKKIRGLLEEGWVLGKYKIPKIPTKNKADISREKNYIIYKEYYEIYKINGWDKFVEITGYTKSKQNLVQRFAFILQDEFKPQNGKKR